MKTFFFLLLLTVSGIAQSQMEMTQDAGKAFEKADAQLYKTYQKLLAESDEDAQKKLKTAQRAWVVFRDAEASYAADDEARGGSMEPMVFAYAQRDLTLERLTYLKKLLESAHE